MKRPFFLTRTIPEIDEIGWMLIKKQFEVFWNSNWLELIRIDGRIKNSLCYIYTISDDNNIREIRNLNSLINFTSDYE